VCNLDKHLIVYNTSWRYERIYAQICYKYTYICIYDSLIIGKFWSPLQFVKIGCYTRFIAHPKKNLYFSVQLSSFFCRTFKRRYVLVSWFVTFTINTPVSPPSNVETLSLLHTLPWSWICDRRSVGQCVLVSGSHLEPKTRFFFFVS
jgi:hypothetical protein